MFDWAKYASEQVHRKSYDRILHDSLTFYRSSPPEMLLENGILEIYSKFTGEHPCRNVFSIKLQSSFFEIKLRQGCFPVNLL